jgi:uncharacterized membrane protein
VTSLLEKIAPFGRVELLHPAVVHFPVALLVFAVGLYLAACLGPARWRSTLLWAARLNLVAGVAGAWLGLWTGEEAEDVVNRVICDPTVTHAHSDWAHWATWLASAALVVEGSRHRWASSPARRKADLALSGFVAVALLAVAGMLMRAGHLGASLVYQQAAGVQVPDEKCTGFE